MSHGVVSFPAVLGESLRLAKRKKSRAKKVASKRRGHSRRAHAKARPERVVRKAPVKKTRQKTARKQIPRRVVRLSREESQQLTSALKLIRKHVHGYGSADGYDIAGLGSLSSARRRRLVAKAATLKELTATPHDLIRAPTRKARRSLVQFTRQRLRKAKHFIVHKPEDRYRVRLKKGNISVQSETPDGRVKSESRYFLFPHRARDPDDVEAMTRALLREMPEGFYTVLTGALGDTGEPADKGMILRRVQEYMNFYSTTATGESTGFTQALVGFRYMADTLDGALTARNTVDHRRQRVREWNEKRKLALRRGKELADYNEMMRLRRIKLARQRGARKAAATKRKKARGKK